MAIHHIETVFIDDKHVRAFATEETAKQKAEDVAKRFMGAVNVRIHPVIAKGKVKYTPVFYCFREESDLMCMLGTGFYSYR